MADLLF